MTTLERTLIWIQTQSQPIRSPTRSFSASQASITSKYFLWNTRSLAQLATTHANIKMLPTTCLKSCVFRMNPLSLNAASTRQSLQTQPILRLWLMILSKLRSMWLQSQLVATLALMTRSRSFSTTLFGVFTTRLVNWSRNTTLARTTFHVKIWATCRFGKAILQQNRLCSAKNAQNLFQTAKYARPLNSVTCAKQVTSSQQSLMTMAKKSSSV